MSTLATDLQEIVNRLVEGGEYVDEEAVLRRALVMLDDHERVMEGIREGLADVEAGRVMSIEESQRLNRERLNSGHPA